MWKNNIFNRVLFFGSIFLIFYISYLRYTYYINPNLSGEPFMIKIALSEIASQENLNNENKNQSYRIDNRVIAKSIIVFWLLFGIMNSLLLYTWRGSQKDLAFHLIVWAGLTLVILCFAGFHFILRPEGIFFGLFTKIKNFMLSLLYTGVIFIFAKFFNRIVAKE